MEINVDEVYFAVDLRIFAFFLIRLKGDTNNNLSAFLAN